MTNQYKYPNRLSPGLLFLTGLLVVFLVACGAGENLPLVTLPVGQVNSQSGTGGQSSPAQATPQEMATVQVGIAVANPAVTEDSNLLLTPPSLSTDELATRDAFLNQTGKSAPILPAEPTPKPGGNGRCLGTLGTLLVAFIVFGLVTKRKPQ